MGNQPEQCQHSDAAERDMVRPLLIPVNPSRLVMNMTLIRQCKPHIHIEQIDARAHDGEL
jgi:hypothetical protein